jgi:hypothetical protein
MADISRLETGSRMNHVDITDVQDHIDEEI